MVIAIKSSSALRSGIMSAIASVGAIIVSPAQATEHFNEATALRSLDIMLMVTSLRCRTGPHDFRSDYNRFTSRHLSSLNAANATLRRGLGDVSLDRMSVRLANGYGDGHPWLDCAELKQVARELSREPDGTKISAIARWVLQQNPAQRTSRIHYEMASLLAHDSVAMP